MAASKDPLDWIIVSMWIMSMAAFTVVTLIDWNENRAKLKAIENAETRTWDEAAWTCRSPVGGANAQIEFKGALIQQTSAAQDRLAFAPELRSACHSCRAENGNRGDGYEMFVPGGANATVGISAAMLAMRAGLLTVGGFYDTSVPADAIAARCTSGDAGSFYLVWNTAAPHICFCRAGTEHCSDPMLGNGDASLNCVGGSTVTATDCSACAPGNQLC